MSTYVSLATLPAPKLPKMWLPKAAAAAAECWSWGACGVVGVGVDDAELLDEPWAMREPVVSDMGPPTSMGESVLREFEGLLGPRPPPLMEARGVCSRMPEGEGEPALMEPSDCEAECGVAVSWLDDSGRSLSLESRWRWAPLGLRECCCWSMGPFVRGLCERWRGGSSSMSSSISPVMSGDDSRESWSCTRKRVKKKLEK